MTAAFQCAVADFCATSANDKLGALSSAAGKSGFATQYLQQISAWETELEILASCATQIIAVAPSSREWHFLLEYQIPRRCKRPDLILIADDIIIIVEFKIAATSFNSTDEWQVYSYALDLRDFHAESSGRRIIPLLVATGTTDLVGESCDGNEPNNSAIVPVQRLGANDGKSLAAELLRIYGMYHDESAPRIDAASWNCSAYRPAPNIIEAAETLFAGHSVADISHSFAMNLRSTSRTLIEAIEHAQRERCRTICFVTGIPGAGKTLAGLNAVHDPNIRRNDRPSAAFLSGNGPLVKVVREALIRNRVAGGVD
ncbi:MAG TPA: DNA/RNA helicase domain-containing protein, partial [Pirellulales bacterium]|nr:DNA/RNA helicase domain-containing protein [Pirellulales bacterium]